MRKNFKFLIPVVLLIGAVALATWLLSGHNVAVLNPGGIIADKQRNLMILSTLIMLVVVIPVFVLTFVISWRYRAGNTKAKYTPDWDHHRWYETIWWGLPLAIIAILSVIIWQSSHELDPYRPLASDKKPVTIQVVALQWKWLFIYPEHNIASVNYIQFPVDTPVNFEITADAPMNSFWIPQLGGQVYAMAGMKTTLHLEANKLGSYDGVSANLSGQGFAGMKFVAKASLEGDFYNWLSVVKQSPGTLNTGEYAKLTLPSENNPVAYYPSVENGLYDKVIMKYMMPQKQTDSETMQPMPDMPGMDHSGHH
jgi:cytochrome o ubiquinol oxidase subunit 2